MRIAGHGISVDVPPGWEGRITSRAGGGPVMHVATFALRGSDGDFGAAATGRMRAGDAFAALLEFRDERGSIPGGVGLFEHAGRPSPQPREFAPMQLQVTRPGQLGCQRFFTEAGRTCCLYAVIQPGEARPDRLVAELRDVVASIELSSRGPVSR